MVLIDPSLHVHQIFECPSREKTMRKEKEKNNILVLVYTQNNRHM